VSGLLCQPGTCQLNRPSDVYILISAMADVIANGSTECSAPSRPPPSVTISYDPQLDVCTEIDVNITGGVPPYRLSLLAGSEGMYASTSPFYIDRVRLQNSVVGDQQFTVFASDATNATSLVSQQFTSLDGLSRCALHSVPNATAASANLFLSVASLASISLAGLYAAIFVFVFWLS